MAGRKQDMARTGRIGAWRLFATHDARAVTAPARAAFAQRFYDGIPEDLPPAERDRRATYARKAYFASLSLRGVEARRQGAARHRPSIAVMPPPIEPQGIAGPVA